MIDSTLSACRWCGRPTPQPQGEAYARTSDPATSKVAAATVDANALEQLVLDTLGPTGERTVPEIATQSGRDKWSISPRMAPLVRKGLVVDTGKRRDRCIVWARTTRPNPEEHERRSPIQAPVVGHSPDRRTA